MRGFLPTIALTAAMGQAALAQDLELTEMGRIAAELTPSISAEEADDCQFAFDWHIQSDPSGYGELQPFANAFWQSYFDVPGEGATDDELFATEWQAWVASGFHNKADGKPSAKKIAKSIKKKHKACMVMMDKALDVALAEYDAEGSN